MKNIKLKKKKLLLSLEKNLGIVTAACKEVGISRNQFYVYYREDPYFKEAVDDIDNIVLDFTETQLYKKIKEGSERSILFYMRYKGRKRGYTDNIDITSGNEKIEGFVVKIIKPNDDIDD